MLDGPTYEPYGDGKIYAAPLFFSVNGMWYDSNLFEKNSWEVPETWGRRVRTRRPGQGAGHRDVHVRGSQRPGPTNESVIWPMIATIGGKDKLDAILQL